MYINLFTQGKFSYMLCLREQGKPKCHQVFAIKQTQNIVSLYLFT